MMTSSLTDDESDLTHQHLVHAACSPNMVSERFWELAQYSDEMAGLVAANPTAPPALLNVLINHEVEAVRHAVMRNPQTPQATLLAQANTYPVPFIENPSLKLSWLDQTFFHRLQWQAVRQIMAMEHPPAIFLDAIPQIYIESGSRERAKLVSYPPLPARVINQLLEIITREIAENEHQYANRSCQAGIERYYQTRSYQMRRGFLQRDQLSLLQHPNYGTSDVGEIRK